MNTVVLSLGSNLGDRKNNLELAIGSIEESFMVEGTTSSIYETVPWGFETDELFLNCCMAFESSETPQNILKELKVIEKQLGRVKKSQNNKYFSRLIDIDILYVGDLIVQTEDLVVPHPRLYDRSFVLTPLAELLPDFIDPVRKQRTRELLNTLNDEKEVILYEG